MYRCRVLDDMPPQTHETLKKGRKKKNGIPSVVEPIDAEKERVLALTALFAMQPDCPDEDYAEALGEPVEKVVQWKQSEYFRKQLSLVAMQSRLKPALTTIKWRRLVDRIPDMLEVMFDKEELADHVRLRAMEFVGDRDPSGMYAKRTRAEVHHTHEVSGIDMDELHRKALESGYGPKEYLEVIPEGELVTVDAE